jgi:hypothetical protein
VAFPTTVRRATAVSSTTNNTAWTPSFTWNTNTAISNGDHVLWILVVASDGNPTLSESGGNGWTKQDQTSDATVACTGAIFTKATTTAFSTSTGPSFVLASTASEQYSAVLLAFKTTSTNAILAIATAAQGSSTNANPPSVSYGSTRDMTIVETRSGDSTTVATAASTNYANLQTATGGGTNGASTNTAERQLSGASSEDPGTFTSSNDQWVSYTIAVGEAISTNSTSNATSTPVATVVRAVTKLLPIISTPVAIIGLSRISSYKSPGTVVDDATGIGNTWTNDDGTTPITASKVATENDSQSIKCVQAGSGFSDYVVCTNLGFTTSDIPPGSTINGIEVDLWRFSNTSSGNSGTGAARLVVGGVATGTNKTLGTWGGTTSTESLLGGSQDLWGATVTDSDIRGSGFGVQFRNNAGAFIPTISIDKIALRIYFTPGTGSTTPQTISITSTATFAVIRSTGKPLSIVSTLVANILRASAKPLSITSTPVATVIRAISQTARAITSTPVAAVVRSAGKIANITSTDIATLVRRAGKLVNVTSTGVASRGATAITKAISAVSTPVAAVVKALTQTARNITSTPVATVIKSTNKAFAIVSTPVARLVRQAGKLVNAVSTPVPSRGAFQIGKLVNVITTPTFTIVRAMTKAISASSTPVATLIRSTGKLINALSTPIATVTVIRVYLRTIAALTTPVGAIVRSTNKLINVASTPVGTVVRALTKTAYSITTTSVATVFKSTTRLASIASTAVPSLVRRAGKLINAVSTPIASASRLVGKLVSALTTPVAMVQRTTSKAFSIVSTGVATIVSQHQQNRIGNEHRNCVDYDHQSS